MGIFFPGPVACAVMKNVGSGFEVYAVTRNIASEKAKALVALDAEVVADVLE